MSSITLARDPVSEPLAAVLQVFAAHEAALRAFLADCRAAGNLRWGEIDGFTEWWWGKRAPRNVLTGNASDIGEDDGQI